VIGYRRNEVIGKTTSEIGLWAEPQERIEALARGRTDGHVRNMEMHFRKKNGDIGVGLLSAEMIELNGKHCTIATTIDITDRKRAEAALFAERQKFNTILDSVPPYVVLLTPDYHVGFANREFCTRFGEHKGRKCYEFLFNRTEPCEVCETYKVLTDDRPRNWQWTGPDGRHYDIFDFPFTDTDGSKLILEMGIDVTEQRQAEQKLLNSTRYVRSLIEASMDPLVTISREGKITDVNEATEKVTGLSRSELVGSDFSNYFTEPEKARGGYQRVFAEGAVRDYPLAIRHQSGQVTDVLYNATVYTTESGEVEGVFAAARDITESKKAEKKVRQQAALIELAHDAIIVCDLSRRVLFWNRAASDLYGWSSEQAVGRVIHELLQTEFPASREAVEACLLQVREWEGELTQVSHDGKKIVVASRWSLLRDENGEPAATLEINRDITERKKAEEKLRQVSWYTRSLIEASLDPLVTISRDGKIADVNQATEKATGVSREKLIGSDFSEYFTEPAKARQGYETVFAQGTVRDYPLAIRHDSGNVMDVLYNATVLRNEKGEIEVIFAAARDVTDIRKAHQEIQALNESLERKVQERTNQLTEANRELESFTYAVAHDLRAPLRHIHGFSSILAEEAAELSAASRQHLKFINEGVERMSRLLEDLLNLSRTSRQELRLQLCGMKSLVDQVIAELKPDIADRQVEWKLGDLPFAKCDPSLMKYALTNLLSNALKFTRPREQAVIEIGTTEKDGEQAIFVRDNGVGFDMQYADKLFGVFQRLHRQEDFAGTGVGLALVQRIIRKHGGRVWAEGELNQGATFYFTPGEISQGAANAEENQLDAV